MQEYRCQDCGEIFVGWGVSKICPKCGGKLEPSEEKKETNKKEEQKI